MKNLKTLIPAALLLALVLSYLVPTPQAEAQTIRNPWGNLGTDDIPCVIAGTAGNVLAPFITNVASYALGEAFNALTDQIPGIDTVLKWINKPGDWQGFITRIFDLRQLFGGASVPTGNESLEAGLSDFFTTDLNLKTVERAAARCYAKKIQRSMSGNAINAIRTSGRNGGPVIIKDWRKFETSAQYRGENVFRSELNQTTLCPQYDRQVKTMFNAQGQPALSGQNSRIDNFESFSQRNNCTLPSDFNMTDYRQDFAGNGGWEAFSRLTQPQNNVYGAIFNSLDEAARQRNFEHNTDVNEAVAGNGYESRRAGTTATGNTTRDRCAIMGRNGQCLVQRQIVTPGSAFGGLLASVIGQEIGWLTNVQQVNDVVSDTTEDIINWMLDLGGDDTVIANGTPPNPNGSTIFCDPRNTNCQAGTLTGTVPAPNSAAQCAENDLSCFMLFQTILCHPTNIAGSIKINSGPGGGNGGTPAGTTCSYYPSGLNNSSAIFPYLLQDDFYLTGGAGSLGMVTGGTAAGVHIWLCSEVAFQGTCVEFTASAMDLSATLLGLNNVRSMVINPQVLGWTLPTVTGDNFGQPMNCGLQLLSVCYAGPSCSDLDDNDNYSIDTYYLDIASGFTSAVPANTSSTYSSCSTGEKCCYPYANINQGTTDPNGCDLQSEYYDAYQQCCMANGTTTCL